MTTISGDVMLSPHETGQKLRDLLWREFELSRLCAGWTPAVTAFADKYQLAQFAYWHSRRVRTLAERVAELPGSAVEAARSPATLREAVERIGCAPNEAAFWAGYCFLLNQIHADYDHLQTQLDPVTNAPTMDTLSHVLVDRAPMNRWLAAQVSADATWNEYARTVWNARDSGSWPLPPDGAPIGPVPPVGQCDPRMLVKTYDDMVVALPAEKRADFEMYADPLASPLANSARQMIYINATEVIAGERLAYLYYGVNGLPLEFYWDTARHMWDEFRHAAMGLRRLEQLGHRVEDFCFFGRCRVPADTTAIEHYEFYSDLTNSAEGCSFPYKRACAEALRQYDDVVSAIQTEFDIADERLHTGYGRKWGATLYEAATGERLSAEALVERHRVARLRARGYTDAEIAERKRSMGTFCGATSRLGELIEALARQPLTPNL